MARRQDNFPIPVAPRRNTLPDNPNDNPFGRRDFRPDNHVETILHPLPHRPRNTVGTSLRPVPSMTLKVLRRPDGTNLGLTITPSSSTNTQHNVFSPLPDINNGIVFRASSANVAMEAYRRAGAGEVVGIMFPPAKVQGNVIEQTVGWDCLVPPMSEVKKVEEKDGGFRLSEMKTFLPKIEKPPKSCLKF